MALINLLKLNISKKLKEDDEFRKDFFKGQAQDIIAMDVRALRKKRSLRQSDLAKKSGMTKSAIYRIEQSEYCSWTFKTLLKVANVLDARLRVILEPSEKVIEEYEDMENELDSQTKEKPETPTLRK